VAEVAHRVDVARPHTLLKIDKPLPRRVLGPQKIRHKRVHTCGREQHGRVIFGNQTLPLNLRMTVFLKKLYIFGA